MKVGPHTPYYTSASLLLTHSGLLHTRVYYTLCTVIPDEAG